MDVVIHHMGTAGKRIVPLRNGTCNNVDNFSVAKTGIQWSWSFGKYRLSCMIRAIKKSRMDIVLNFFAGQTFSLILTVSFLVLNSALKGVHGFGKTFFGELMSVNN